jgi:type I restriction enzyme S subunit
MSKLPEGWAQAKIRDTVVDYETVDPRKSPDQSFLYVDIGAIDNSVKKITAPKEFSGREAPSRARRVIRANDVLFSTVRTYLKNVAQVPEYLDRQLTSTGICVLRANEITDPGFLFRWVSSSDFINEISEAQDGTMYPAVRDEDVLSGPIPLPPLSEQQRIVRKLDTLSARTTSARTNLAAIAKLVERYKASVLKNIFVEAGRKHSMKSLATLCTSITDGDHQAPPKASEGIPFITISAINTGTIDLSKATRFVPEAYYEDLKSERRPQKGDLLYSVTGSIGIPAPVEEDFPFVFQRHIAILRPDVEKLIQSYLLFALQSPQVRQQGLECATGIAQLTIPLRGLRDFVIPAPSVDEQREIVHRIDSAFSKIDLLAFEAEKAIKLTDRLDQRILAKAFAGELVRQDPNDEPANALLERIREARANAPKKPRKKPTKAKPMKVAPEDRVLTDSVDWPDQGLQFEDIAKRLTLPHDDLKDAVFALLEGDTPKLRQKFDTDEKVMKLVRVTS